MTALYAAANRLVFLLLTCALLAFGAAAQQPENPQEALAKLENKFNAAVKKAHCDRREEALKLGRDLVEAYRSVPASEEKIRHIEEQMASLERRFDEKWESLETLFSEFKACRKCPCGQRSESIRLGRRIIELHRSDEQNQAIIQYIEKNIDILEKEEPVCILGKKYEASYFSKNWTEFFALSDELMAMPEFAKVRVDVAITAADTANVKYVETGESRYLDVAVRFARRAVDLIESGVVGRWGTYNPFRSREEALKAMNEIINRQVTKN